MLEKWVVQFKGSRGQVLSMRVMIKEGIRAQNPSRTMHAKIRLGRKFLIPQNAISRLKTDEWTPVALRPQKVYVAIPPPCTFCRPHQPKNAHISSTVAKKNMLKKLAWQPILSPIQSPIWLFAARWFIAACLRGAIQYAYVITRCLLDRVCIIISRVTTSRKWFRWLGKKLEFLLFGLRS